MGEDRQTTIGNTNVKGDLGAVTLDRQYTILEQPRPIPMSVVQRYLKYALTPTRARIFGSASVREEESWSGI